MWGGGGDPNKLKWLDFLKYSLDWGYTIVGEGGANNMLVIYDHNFNIFSQSYIIYFTWLLPSFNVCNFS